jgi:protein TonB
MNASLTQTTASKQLTRLALVLALLFAVAGPAMHATPVPGRENPIPVRTVRPEYPTDLKRNKVSGLVVVKCTIDIQGNVSDANVVKSSNELFDQFATDALKKWKFKPARQDGEPVSMQVNIPVKFVAEES